MEALSLVANIISVIDLTTKVVERLNDIKSSIDGVPQSLQVLAHQFPIFKLQLKEIDKALKNGSMSEDRRAAIKPLVDGFEIEVKGIDEIIEKIKPKGSSKRERSWKAVSSFIYDTEIERRKDAIMAYIATLSFDRVMSGPLSDLAAAAPPPPVPDSTCPFDANPDFVDRALLTELLNERKPGSRHAIVGGAGVGKTQIANEYGHRIRQLSPDTWVFWVTASSMVKLEEGYREIAEAVRISGRHDKDADLFSLVLNWMRNASNGNWVLIVDNADDKDVICGQPSGHKGDKRVRDFLPQSANGSILVTSRNREAAFIITGNYRYITQLDEMSEKEAIAVFQSHFKDAHPEDDVKTLVKALGYIPLTIHGAAATINQMEMTIPEYLERLKREDESSAGLMDEDSPDLRRELNRSNSIVATWRITFEYVNERNPSAARLLSLMCLFDWQDIPKALLEENYGQEVTARPLKPYEVWRRSRPRTRTKKRQPAKGKKGCNFEEDWLTLRGFCLIKLNRDRRYFSMHPLVQFTTKRWLVAQQVLDPWSQHFINIIDDNFPDAHIEDTSKCEPLLAHANAAFPYRPKSATMPSQKLRWLRKHRTTGIISPLQHWASLSQKLGNYYEQRGALDTAQKIYLVACEAFDASAGPAAAESLRCYSQRGLTLCLLERAPEAEAIHRRVLIVRQKSLGPTHRDTLVAMENLGEDLEAQGQYAEAERLFKEAITGRLATMGAKHKDTQDALSAYAFFVLARSRYKEACNIWREAYNARLPDNNGALDQSWTNQLDMIGYRLLMDGRPEQAEAFVRESLEEKKSKLLDPDDIEYHPLIRSRVILAKVLRAQGKYTEAEPHYRYAFDWYEKKLDSDCYSTHRLETAHDLTFVLFTIGDFQKAESLARQGLAEALERPHPENRGTFEQMWLLGTILEKKEEYGDALRYYQLAYEGTKKLLGEDHEDTKDFKADFEKLQQKSLERLAQGNTVSNEPNSNPLLETLPQQTPVVEAGQKGSGEGTESSQKISEIVCLDETKELNESAYSTNAALRFVGVSATHDPETHIVLPDLPGFPDFPSSEEMQRRRQEVSMLA